MVNIHLTIESEGFGHLIDKLKEDGNEVRVEYDSDDKKILYATVTEARIFINPGVENKAVIHDPTYSRTYFRAQSPVVN